MTVLETLGLFYVILATGVFTAATLTAAVWSITLGVKVATRRYKIGEEMEKTMEETKPQRSGR